MSNRRLPAKRHDSRDASFEVAVALALALVLSPIVRSITAELDDTLGQAWPFSLSRCHVSATPGCAQRGTWRVQASR